MADVVLHNNIRASHDFNPDNEWGPYWHGATVVTTFAVDVNGDLVAIRSTTGLNANATVTVIYAGDVTGLSAWYDAEQPGKFGTKVHLLICDDEDDALMYMNYDVATGTPSTPVVVKAAAGIGTPNGNFCCIGQSVSGHMFATLHSQGVFRSTDGGASWAAYAGNIYESAAADKLYWIPCNNPSDPNMIAFVFFDVSASELTVKALNTAGSSWTESAAFGTGITHSSTVTRQVDTAADRQTKHGFCVAWNAVDAVGADLLAWDINVTAHNAVTVTAKTDVGTAAEAGCCAVMIDPNPARQRIFVAYLQGGTFSATVTCNWAYSDDGGTTWNGFTAMQEDAADDHRFIAHTAAHPAGGYFMPAWADDDDNDLFASEVNRQATGVEPQPGGIASFWLRRRR